MIRLKSTDALDTADQNTSNLSVSRPHTCLLSLTPINYRLMNGIKRFR